MRNAIRWAGALSVAAVAALAAASPGAQQWSFDADGNLPAGWRAGATGGKAATWHVAREPKAPSPPNVLAIERLNDGARGNFNLFWLPAAGFRDGSLEVSIRADRGEVDRGGGLIWRAQDENNYYIARYNPLERNLRLYYVKEGLRRMLADAPDLAIGSGKWFALKVAQRGARIEVWLDGKRLIETSDATFSAPGGVGVWTKADAISAFDDFKVNAEN